MRPWKAWRKRNIYLQSTLPNVAVPATSLGIETAHVVLELHAGVSCCEQQAAILCVDLPLLGIL